MEGCYFHRYLVVEAPMRLFGSKTEWVPSQLNGHNTSI